MLNWTPKGLKIGSYSVLGPKYSLRALTVYARFFGERELTLLKHLCSRTKKSLDIGANRGIYAYAMRRYSASCDAFEPSLELCVGMREALGDRVTVHATALSNRRGTARLVVPLLEGREIDTSATIDKPSEVFSDGPEGFHGVRITEVPVSTLDDFTFAGVGCIKIDVEGHELAVLQGGHQLLHRDTPNLIVEIEERHRKDAVPTVMAFLKELGYEGYFFLARRLWPIARFSLPIHQHFGRRPYINNFLFLHGNAPRPWLTGF